MTETGRLLFPFARRAAASVAVACAPPALAAGESAPDFDREIRPILAAKCFACHGPDAEAREAGLRLDTFEGATAALDEGARAIAPGDPAASLLLARVAHADPEERMPPHGEPLTAAEIDAVRRWIASGAAYADPWAFRPIRPASPPAVRDADWCRNDLDRFVLATRESAGLAAPRADVDPASLLRRLSFDLRGLPPSEADVRAFVAEPSDSRYSELVERYLADPAFGERWGRHWLDLARYAETLAHEFDYEIPHAWRYRDYVIEAFNADLPPARFVAEQIAGDLLSPRPGLGMPNVAPVATAWWFLGPATHAPVNVRQDEADRIAGAVDVAGRSLFGLSIACARCHDHKFDPIPARDFFALAGVARNTRRIEGYLDATPETARLAAEAGSLLADAARAASAQPSLLADSRAADAASFRDDLGDGGASWRRSGHAFATSMPLASFEADGTLRARESGTIDSGRADAALVGSARSATFVIDRPFLHVRVRGTGSGLRVAIDNYWLDDRNGLLFEGMRRGVETADSANDPRGEAWRTETFDLTRFVGERAYVELADHGGGAVEVDWIALTADRAAPDPAAWDIDGPAVLGAPDAPGVAEARASFASVVERLRREPAPVRAIVAEDGGALDEPVHIRGVSRAYGEPAPRARLSILGARGDEPVDGSGRLELVARLTDPAQPFLWRTTANRIWLKLLGRGIVETPDDFGQLGASPVSSELLDHLAARLASGATFKTLIRDIVRSRAYRAAPDAGDAAAPATAWRPEPIRRLDAEAIRDAMLAASGALRDARGGPGVAARLTEHMQGRGRPGRGGPVDGDGRRSVYLEVRRNFLDPFLQAFDQPAPATTCGRRHASNVPAQALALMNSELTHLLAGRWAERMLASGDGDDAARIEAMWYAAFARAPRPDEREAALGFLASEREQPAESADPAARDRAAYAALAHALFAAKEFVFLR